MPSVDKLLDAPVQLILRAQIAEDEGLRLEAYQDTVGVWTIGYGHTRGVKEGDTITRMEAEALLDAEMRNAIEDAAIVAGALWGTLSQVRRATLANVAYNVGRSELMEFERMWGALDEGRWRKAAAELVDSYAAEKTGRRYFKLAYQMMHDRWWT